MEYPQHCGTGTQCAAVFQNPKPCPYLWYLFWKHCRYSIPILNPRGALAQATDDMSCFYDAHCREAPLYMVRDKVWLNGQNIPTTHLMKKLDYKWLGPYAVDKVISWNAYRLKLPSFFSQIHPFLLVTLLWPYNTDAITEWVQCNLPPPVVHDGVEEHEMESILDSQISEGSSNA